MPTTPDFIFSNKAPQVPKMGRTEGWFSQNCPMSGTFTQIFFCCLGTPLEESAEKFRGHDGGVGFSLKHDYIPLHLEYKPPNKHWVTKVLIFGDIFQILSNTKMNLLKNLGHSQILKIIYAHLFLQQAFMNAVELLLAY